MKIDSSISGIQPLGSSITPIGSGAREAAKPEGQSFADMIRSQLDEVARLNDEAGTLQQQLLTGQTTDISQVVQAVQKADMALTFTLQLRNKILDAYQEINRMQI